MISKTIGFRGLHNIFRQTHMMQTRQPNVTGIRISLSSVEVSSVHAQIIQIMDDQTLVLKQPW